MDTKLINVAPVIETIKKWHENAVKRGDAKEVIQAYGNCIKMIELEVEIENGKSTL